MASIKSSPVAVRLTLGVLCVSVLSALTAAIPAPKTDALVSDATRAVDIAQSIEQIPSVKTAAAR